MFNGIKGNASQTSVKNVDLSINSLCCDKEKFKNKYFRGQ